jgi:hypothetical protein
VIVRRPWPRDWAALERSLEDEYGESYRVVRDGDQFYADKDPEDEETASYLEGLYDRRAS